MNILLRCVLCLALCGAVYQLVDNLRDRVELTRIGKPLSQDAMSHRQSDKLLFQYTSTPFTANHYQQPHQIPTGIENLPQRNTKHASSEQAPSTPDSEKIETAHLISTLLASSEQAETASWDEAQYHLDTFQIEDRYGHTDMSDAVRILRGLHGSQKRKYMNELIERARTQRTDPLAQCEGQSACNLDSDQIERLKRIESSIAPLVRLD